jgi:hypothetical protein
MKRGQIGERAAAGPWVASLLFRPRHDPHERHDAVLVNVQTRHTFVDDFHHRLLDEAAGKDA